MSSKCANALQASRARIILLPKAEQSVLHDEGLAAIGHRVTSIAHESRNFLQRIKSAAELLAEIDKDNTEALDAINCIQKTKMGLEHLLEEVRQFSAPMHLDIIRLSLQTVWRAAWCDVTRLSTREARLDESVGDISLECDVDVFRLGQVFRNLFENSLAACDTCSPCIHVRCENGDGLNHRGIRTETWWNPPSYFG
ncbi:hypothetical protein SH528x_001988 [Novipirellula sp. SH528]|uniref:hypothetical protein n=1 Tax=Novipirellula sp. SH528 TaxID=3454466 RepID=UPI003FA06E58